MTQYLDASTFITLAAVGAADLVDDLPDRAVVLDAIAREIVDDPAARRLDEGIEAGWLDRRPLDEVIGEDRVGALVERAGTHLGRDVTGTPGGDVALLAAGLAERESGAVVVTDDKPLRGACKALGVSLSGSLGVVIATVEHDILDAERARDVVVAMDTVGARYSATLLDRAERLIDEAAAE